MTCWAASSSITRRSILCTPQTGQLPPRRIQRIVVQILRLDPAQSFRAITRTLCSHTRATKPSNVIRNRVTPCRSLAKRRGFRIAIPVSRRTPEITRCSTDMPLREAVFSNENRGKSHRPAQRSPSPHLRSKIFPRDSINHRRLVPIFHLGLATCSGNLFLQSSPPRRT